MMGSPIIGRRIRTWIAMPNTNMNTSVIGMPIQNGTWYFAAAPSTPSADQQQLTLREVDDLRRLVDQHERHRDHAIERADHEAVDQELDEEGGVHYDLGCTLSSLRSAAKQSGSFCGTVGA
jgi:hypothetical protein